MARSRNIKPGFFTNEELADCDPLARLLYAGLWCIADREGRLEDRPKRIKAEILPYDDCDTEELLMQLADQQFIARYEHTGLKLIQVIQFGKHQHPHQNEPASKLPEWSGAGPGGVAVVDGSNPADSLLIDSLTSCGEDATLSDGPASANGSEDGHSATSKANGQSFPQSFEEFWQAYPTRGGRKRGKSKCLGIWRQAIRAAERQPLVEAAKHYAASDDSTRGFAKDPERFLRNEWWRDWVPAIAQQQRAPPPAVPQPVPHRIPKRNFT